jgi:hypothetical protein
MGIFRRLIPTAAQEPFIIEVTVSSGDTFTLPLVSYGPTAPDFTVDWGDGVSGSITSVTDLNRVHTYSSTGTYEITMQGFIPGWNVNNDSVIKDKITGIIDFGRTGIKRLSFFGCSNLDSIPSSTTMIANGGTDVDGDGFRDGNGIGYAGLASVVDFTGFMRSTGLSGSYDTPSGIPSGLFDFATNATNMSDLFSFTQVEDVPPSMFDENTSVTSFASAFNGCVSLLTVPDDLFSQNENVLSFSSTFRNCIKLKDLPSFANNSSVTVVDRIASMYTTSNSSSYWTLNNDIDGEHDFWNRSPAPSGTDAYFNCTGIQVANGSDFNYLDIPTAYR